MNGGSSGVPREAAVVVIGGGPSGLVAARIIRVDPHRGIADIDPSALLRH